jgi:hypothetical protein
MRNTAIKYRNTDAKTAMNYSKIPLLLEYITNKDRLIFGDIMCSGHTSRKLLEIYIATPVNMHPRGWIRC